MRLFHNAQIYTLDEELPIASAIVIDHGRIAAIGEDKPIISRYGSTSEVVDLGGRAVIPGLTDAHIHLQHYALGLKNVNCETKTREECLHNVQLRIDSSPPGEWVLGHGWNQNNWPGGFGTAKQLEAIQRQISGPVQCELLADCRHSPYIDQPDAVLSRINRYLSEI